ncbi:MAG: DUF2232 domain-containing protein [Paenibacillaceae bacterium]
MATSSKNMIIWGVLYLLMLLSLVTPLGLITINLMMIPLLLLFVMLDLKRFIIIYTVIAAILIVAIGNGGIVLAFVSMVFLIPSVAMGIQYRKGIASGTAVTTGIIVLIAVMLLLLLISSALGFNITDEFTKLLKSDANFMSMIHTIVQDEDQIDSYIDILISMIPMMIIMIAVYYTMITHWLGRKLLSRLWKPVPKLKPMKEWMLPRSMVWYYVIVLVLNMISEIDTGSTMSVIVLNSHPLLTYAFALQAVGFLFFIADIKGWNRALPIVALILLPFIPSLLAWIGVIDVAFPMRKWARDKSGNHS